MELVVQNREESGYPLSFTRRDTQESAIPLIWTPLMHQEDGFRSYPGGYGKQRRPSLVIPVKNGNYHVKVALGDKEKESSTTIKAGAGSIMLQQIRTKAGEIIEREFIVRVEQQELRLQAEKGTGKGFVRQVEFDFESIKQALPDEFSGEVEVSLVGYFDHQHAIQGKTTISISD